MMTKKLLIILLLIPHLEASELNLQQYLSRLVVRIDKYSVRRVR